MADQPKNNIPGPESGDKNPKKNKGKFNFYWIYGVLAILFITSYFLNWQGEIREINWSELKSMLLQRDVEKVVVVNGETAEIYIKEDKIFADTLYRELVPGDDADAKPIPGPHFKHKILRVENFIDDVDEVQQQLNAQDTTGKSELEKNKIMNREIVPIIPEKRRNWGNEVLGWVIPIIFLLVIWFFLMRMMGRGAGGGQIFNIGKSKAQLFDKNTMVNINFDDVAGLEEAKAEVIEIVDFLKNPKKYTELGGKIPKGALLIGPPGTGKTLLAKAVAGEAKVPFFSISGSDFVEMFVGVGASRVRDLFKQAKEKAPCIIFIDEIDAIGRARGRNPMTGANDERENTLNQLLTEMDGFGSNQGVIILAATNRADILDRALVRAGRFDRQIHVELPDLKEREAIFKVHLKPIKIADVIKLDFLAKQTPGFSGADIANVCNEAALIAARRNKKIVERQDFLDAVDRIIGGLEKRNKIISPQEKKVIAFHESGHASVSWLLEHAHPLVKVTIVPRGKALGAAWYLPEERQITTLEQMYDEMTAALGGRAAEEIVFEKISTGALNDLEKVTKQAYAMVVYFGLNKKIGNISYYDSSGQQEYSFTKPYSEKTAEIIDEEIHELVEKAYARAKQILLDNREKLDILANVLLEKEVIFREDLEEIFGKRPFENEEHILTDNLKDEEKKTEEEEIPKKEDATSVNKEDDKDDPPKE